MAPELRFVGSGQQNRLRRATPVSASRSADLRLSRSAAKPPIRLDTIDWQRMAEPQHDQYDTRVTLAVATASGSPLRPWPYVRPSSDGRPILVGTGIAIRPLEPWESVPQRFAPAPPDHPNLLKAIGLLLRWPAAYAQFLTLFDSVYPCAGQQIPAGMRGMAGGSRSYSDERRFGALYVTVDSAIGCAHGLVRELAHQKLRALGVSLGPAWRLVTNDPAERFPSPIRLGAARPMTVLLHTFYALLYLIELDLQILEAEADPVVRDHILRILQRNVVRMEAGFRTVARHIRTDHAGAQFICSFFSWAHSAIDRAHDALFGDGYETRTGMSGMTRLLDMSA